MIAVIFFKFFDYAFLTCLLSNDYHQLMVEDCSVFQSVCTLSLVCEVLVSDSHTLGCFMMDFSSIFSLFFDDFLIAFFIQRFPISEKMTAFFSCFFRM